MCLIDVAKFIVRVLFEIECIRRFLAIACNQMCNSKQLIINYKKINYICYIYQSYGVDIQTKLYLGIDTN